MRWLLLISLLMCYGNAKAQSDTLKEAPKYKRGVGIGAGFVTGYGLSYRYWPSRLGVQVNFAPYHTSETDQYSAGITFLYPLIPGKITSLFLYQGNHFFYNSETRYYTDNTLQQQSFTPTPAKKRETVNYFNNGVGIGMEIIFAKRIGFNLMMGYAAYKNFTEVNVTGETALYFKF